MTLYLGRSGRALSKPIRYLLQTRPARAHISTVNDRSYTRALELLESVTSNHNVTLMLARGASYANGASLPEMLDWLNRAGYTQHDLTKLKVVHVAGTKGKGSVSAMVSGILAQYNHHAQAGDAKSLGDIGLYTSPHLVSIRERIRINGRPISQEDFAASFFRLWESFTAAAGGESQDPKATKPGFFRYLTLMAFDVFLHKGITSAVFECGIGGEYDSTNILPRDAVSVTAVTKLGIDHVTLLGNTIEKIAWHKAGIFKPGVPAFTYDQIPSAMNILKERAQQIDCPLSIVDLPRLNAGEDIISGRTQLNLQGDFQIDNARLAAAAAKQHITNMTQGTPADWAEISTTALKKIDWPGRCEVRKDENIEWYIDGAHNDDSIQLAARWFTKRQDTSKPVMIIFNQQNRDGVPLLRRLQSILAEGGVTCISHGIFCPNTIFKPQQEEDVTLQRAMKDAWSEMMPESSSTLCGSIEEAVEHARKAAQGKEVHVFVTGSLHLVGGLIRVLERKGRHDKDVI